MLSAGIVPWLTSALYHTQVLALKAVNLTEHRFVLIILYHGAEAQSPKSFANLARSHRVVLQLYSMQYKRQVRLSWYITHVLETPRHEFWKPLFHSVKILEAKAVLQVCMQLCHSPTVRTIEIDDLQTAL